PLGQRSALALRLALAVLLVLAIVGVNIPQVVDRQATVFVADVSASVDQARPAASGFIGQALAAKRPDDAFGVVATARGASVDHVLSTTVATGEMVSLNTAQPTDGTDLADGLRLASDLLPAGYRSR